MCSVLSNLGYLPIAPHLYYTQFLNDKTPDERETGMACGLQQLHDATAIIVVGDDEGRITRGMLQEVTYASYQKIQVIHFLTMDSFMNKYRDIEKYLRVSPKMTDSMDVELYVYVE